MTRGTVLLMWSVRIFGPVAGLGCAGIIWEAAAGTHPRAGVVITWAGITAVTFGWIVPALARLARSWERTARSWKEQALEWRRLYEDSNADMVTLLRADRGERP